jgi:hypothetical protein
VSAAAPDREAGAAIDQAFTEPLPDLMKDVEHIHPAAMMALSHRLLQRDRYYEAFFWALESRLRWYPEHRPSDEDNMRVYLMNVVAADIGDYRRNHRIDIATSIKAMNDALAWDASHPDKIMPTEAKERARAQLKDAIANWTEHKDQYQLQNDEDVRTSQRNAVSDDPYSGMGGNMAGAPYELLAPCDDQKIASFRTGTSRKDDIIRAFGKPVSWDSNDDKSTTLAYYCLRKTPRPAMIAPPVEFWFDFDPNKTLTAVHAPEPPS